MAAEVQDVAARRSKEARGLVESYCPVVDHCNGLIEFPLEITIIWREEWDRTGTVKGSGYRGR